MEPNLWTNLFHLFEIYFLGSDSINYSASEITTFSVSEPWRILVCSKFTHDVTSRIKLVRIRTRNETQHSNNSELLVQFVVQLNGFFYRTFYYLLLNRNEKFKNFIIYTGT
jgi:hypothetical protein